MKTLRVVAGMVACASLWCASPAAAQDRPAPRLEFAAGALLFADDGIVSEGFAGGAAGFYLSPRVAIGPEIAFIQGENHSHLMLTGNVTFDLIAGSRVTPFLVVGGGLFQTRETFPGGTFTSSDGAFTAGGGVRALVSKNLFVGIEARVGWELHLRISGVVGVHLGR